LRLRPIGMVAATAAILLCGCGSNGDDQASSRAPAVVTFQGQVDKGFVGVWKTHDGRAGLDLEPDGVLKLTTIAATPKGDVKSELTGKWAVASGELYLQYKEKSGGFVVIKYPAGLTANALTLGKKGGRLTKIYTRQQRS